MPVVLLSVTANADAATAALARVTAQLGLLDQAVLVNSRTTTQAQTALDAYLRSLSATQTELARITSGLDALATSFRDAAGMIDTAEAALSRYAGTLGGIKSGLDSTGAGLGDLANSFRSASVAAGDGMLVIDAYIARLDALRVAASIPIPVPSPGGGGGANLVTGGALALAGGGGFGRAGSVLATGAAYDVGLGGRAVNALLGPEGLLVGGLLYGGYKAAQAGANFQSAVAQTGAQANRAGDMNTLGQAILDYAAGGKSPYSATTLATSIEPLLAHGYSTTALAQALPSVAQLSAQNKAPDLTTAANAINTYLALTGTGPKSTGGQITAAADFVSRMETLTTIPPGQISTALPRLLAGAIGTGVSPEDAGALMLKVGTANPSARLDATGITRLISDILVKPTAGAQKTAAELGLAIGPGALSSYGGNVFALLQAYQNATAGPNQTKLLSQIFTQTNALQAAQELFSGGGIDQTVGYAGQLAGAGGAAQAAFNQYSQGINQQGTQLMNRFNADLTTLGDTLNQGVTPALIAFGSNLLSAAEGLAQSGLVKDTGDVLGMIGHAWDVSLPQIRQALGLPALAGLTNPASSGPAPSTTLPGGAPAVVPYDYIGPLNPGQTRAPAVVPNAFVGPLNPGQTRQTAAEATAQAWYAAAMTQAGLSLAPVRPPDTSALTGALAGGVGGIGLLQRQQAALAPGGTSDVARTVKDLKDALAADKISGNYMDYAQTAQALLAYESANLKTLKLDPADLQLQAAQFAHVLAGLQPSVNVHPFFQQNAGLGGLIAGNQSTAVRLGGGGPDPQTQEIRTLRTELNTAQNKIASLLAEIATLLGKPLGQAATRPNPAGGFGSHIA
jgi:hypothetical protein